MTHLLMDAGEFGLYVHRKTNYSAKQRLLADRDYPVTMSSYWAQF